MDQNHRFHYQRIHDAAVTFGEGGGGGGVEDPYEVIQQLRSALATSQSHNDELRRRNEELAERCRELQTEAEGGNDELRRQNEELADRCRNLSDELEDANRRSLAEGTSNRCGSCPQCAAPEKEEEGDGSTGEDGENRERQDNGESEHGSLCKQSSRAIPEEVHEGENKRLSLQKLEEETPNPLGEEEDDAFINGLSDPTGAFIQKCNWLRAFKNKHGHCNIPINNNAHKRLRGFEARVRKQYKHFVRGENSKQQMQLSKARVQLLDDIGINWGIPFPKEKVDVFDEMLGKLREFHRKWGHCCVQAVLEAVHKSKNNVEADCDGEDDGNAVVDPELNNWVKKQKFLMGTVRRYPIDTASPIDSAPRPDYVRHAHREMTPNRIASLEALNCFWLNEHKTADVETNAPAAEADGESSEVPAVPNEQPILKQANSSEAAVSKHSARLKLEKVPKKKSARLKLEKARKAVAAPCSHSHWLCNFELLRKYKGENGDDVWGAIKVAAFRTHTRTGPEGWFFHFHFRRKRMRQLGMAETPLDEQRWQMFESTMGYMYEEIEQKFESIRQAAAIERDIAIAKQKQGLIASLQDDLKSSEKALVVLRAKRMEAKKLLRAHEGEISRERTRRSNLKKTLEEETKKRGLDMVGKHAVIAQRGDRRTGTAIITGIDKVKVLNENLVFYHVKWPEDGVEEKAIEGKFVQVEEPERMVKKSKPDLPPAMRTRGNKSILPVGV